MSLSEKLGVKKSNVIGLIIVAAIVIYGIVESLLLWINGGVTNAFVMGASLAIYALIIYFVILGYKVPNGKMLKYVFLLFALKLGLLSGMEVTTHQNIAFILYMCSAILTAFIGGRLPRVKENKINGTLLLVMTLAAGTAICVNLHIFAIDIFNSFIQALALVLAYQSRAQQYKENSGILDDK